MKKYVTLSLFVFFAITVAVLTAGLIKYDTNKESGAFSNNTSGTTDTVNQVGSITGVNSGGTSLALSKAELVKHNSSQSCWLLISGKIYDVTTFLPDHPGEAKTILPTCGTDATSAYATMGSKGKSHSSNATAMLADYYIGDLNQVVKTSTNPSNPSGQATPAIANPSAATNPPVSRGDDDEFDD
jgi:cytochrome b involved in lipid metabolism